MSFDDYEETAYSESDVESYFSSMISDDESVLSDIESVLSDAEYNRRPFHLRREDGQKPVYEAYRLRLSIETEARPQETTTKWKVLGVTIASRSHRPKPYPYGKQQTHSSVKFTAVEADQAELAEMHLQELEQFQSKNRRSWVSRALRGKPGTYEQHVHEKCRQFPPSVQQQLHGLLEHREEATSTNHHTRKWTIAVVDEEEPFRFSEVTTPKAKHHKASSWKTKDSIQSSKRSYFVVIRGSEVKASSDPEGFTQFYRHFNPWVYSDVEEARRRDREHRRKMRQQRSLESWKRGGVSPAPSRRRARPAYFERGRSRSRSPPSYRQRRDPSTGAESVDVVARARTYIHATRNAPPAAPMPPSRRNPIFHGAPPPPPPGFAMPMPGLSPRMAPPPPPMPMEPPYDRDRAPCFLPAVPPGPPSGIPPARLSEQGQPLGAVPCPRPSVYVKPFQEFGYRPASLGGDDGELPWTMSCVPPRAKSACAGCKVTADCEHFSGEVCRRSMSFQRINGEPRYFHPDCFICMAKSSTPPAPAQQAPLPNLTPPIPPMPTANSAELSGSPPVGPPPYPSLTECFRDKDCWGDTDIESDNESDDGEVSTDPKKDD